MTTTDMAGAIFTEGRRRRHVLWRIWDDSKKVAMCIGLNPSTANESKNDRTISFLVKFLEQKGYGGLRMTNLFTQVTPNPKELNDFNSDLDLGVLKTQAMLSQEIIFCWGGFKEAQRRADRVKLEFLDALCLDKNIDGSPKHPAWYIRNGFDVRRVPLIKYL